MSNKKQKRTVVNMNYPPDDMPLEEQERFWGTVTKEDIEQIEKARNAAIKRLRNGKNHARPSPV